MSEGATAAVGNLQETDYHGSEHGVGALRSAGESGLCLSVSVGAIFDTWASGGLSSGRSSYQFRSVEFGGHRSGSERSFSCVTFCEIPENGMNRQVDAMIFNVVNTDFDAVRFTVQTQLTVPQTSSFRRATAGGD